MFLPSPLSGWLADRYGRRPVLAASGVTLLAAGVLAAGRRRRSVALLALALALLGIGWNFGLVGGTALLTDASPPRPAHVTQGNVDLLVALAGATGGISSGAVVALGGFGLLGWTSAALSLALIPAVARVRVNSAPGQADEKGSV